MNFVFAIDAVPELRGLIEKKVFFTFPVSMVDRGIDIIIIGSVGTILCICPSHEGGQMFDFEWTV